MITRAITNAFRIAQERGWERTYWAFDIHGTIIVPNYKSVQIPTDFYPHAKEALQRISKLEDVCMILYTCSHPHELDQYVEFFRDHEIHFKYVNDNPEVATEGGTYGCYDKKFYFNVLFEDKAGFDPVEDWPNVNALLDKIESERLKINI